MNSNKYASTLFRNTTQIRNVNNLEHSFFLDILNK